MLITTDRDAQYTKGNHALRFSKFWSQDWVESGIGTLTVPFSQCYSIHLNLEIETRAFLQLSIVLMIDGVEAKNDKFEVDMIPFSVRQITYFNQTCLEVDENVSLELRLSAPCLIRNQHLRVTAVQTATGRFRQPTTTKIQSVLRQYFPVLGSSCSSTDLK